MCCVYGEVFVVAFLQISIPRLLFVFLVGGGEGKKVFVLCRLSQFNAKGEKSFCVVHFLDKIEEAKRIRREGEKYDPACFHYASNLLLIAALIFAYGKTKGPYTPLSHLLKKIILNTS